MNPQSKFLFTVCQVGAELALKKELAREHPELRFAFSRPGFVTFKRADGEDMAPDFELKSVFARAYGLSFGKAAVEEILAKSAEWEKPLRLHLWERDQFKPGEEPSLYRRGRWIPPDARPRLEGSGVFEKDPTPQTGDRVVDVIAVEPNELWLGCHLHSLSHSSFVGGRPEVAMPEAAPSRAYLKLEEGIRFSGAPLKAGEVAVEIGSAPGGAVYSLLERGLQVIGVDPAEMDPKLRSHPKFRHLRTSFVNIEKQDLPPAVHWILIDINGPPDVALIAVKRIASLCADSLKGILLTLKLNQWSLAEQIPWMLGQVREMGMTRVRATQLPSNAQEIFVFGLTRKGSLK